MDQTDLSARRVLLVGPKNHAIQVLRSVLAIVGVGKALHIEQAMAALERLHAEHFDAIFCALDGEAQIRFVPAVRRRNGALNPAIPIILLQSQARRRQVEKARDSGATDVLTTPISPRTVAAKLRAAIMRPRRLVVAQEFFGPDRRSKTRPAYFGNDRRKKTPKK